MASPDRWYVGVGLEILSTLSGTVGKQLIRYSELRRSTAPRISHLSLLTGLFVNTVVGPLVDMGAYSFAPQSLIAPFGGLDVVWNALLAPYVLQESLTFYRLLGCTQILLGTVVAGVFGNHRDSDFALESLQDKLLNTRVLLYSLAFAAWFLFNRQFLMRYPSGSAIRGVSLGCTAGTIAGNMFCVKAFVEVVQKSITDGDGSVWLHWLPYCMFLGAVFFALTNVIYMTQGLREYEALFMVTIYEGSMIISGCLSGAVVLLDLHGLETWKALLYGSGVLLIVGGMYVIFSQEAMCRSSLIQGNASIQVPEVHQQPFRKLVTRRSFHAACPPALPSRVGVIRSRSDPLPATPKALNNSRQDTYPTVLAGGSKGDAVKAKVVQHDATFDRIRGPLENFGRSQSDPLGTSALQNARGEAEYPSSNLEAVIIGTAACA